MKALRWHGQGDIRVDDIPRPTPAEDEVILQVTYSGICGSEVHEYAAGPLFIPMEPHPLTGTCAPQTLGHEFGGRIVEVGSQVDSHTAGQLVTVNPILACGSCGSCRRQRPSLCEKLAYFGAIGDGGHADFAKVKAANCVPVPDDVPGEYVAFGEPAGVAYHAVNQGHVGPGSRVAVVGGGPIGQLAVQYAKLAGAEKVFLTEIAPTRIEFARSVGAADEIFNPVETNVLEEVLQRTDGEGVDVAIECGGGSQVGLLLDTANQAVELTRPEGTIVMVGTFSEATELHFNNVVLLERRIQGAWAWHHHEEFRQAMQAIIEGQVKVLPLISRKLSLDEALEEGIKDLLLNKDQHLKIVVDFS